MPGHTPARIKKTRWFICLFIWWVFAVFCYLFIVARESDQVGRITKIGTATVIENAEKAALPLLERDVQALTGLAQEAARKKGVVNVSIIDHKNKIIAYTNPDQPVPPLSISADRQKSGGHWQLTLDDGTQAVCFSADINYAATKIGEVFLVMTAGASGNLATVFTLSALVSLLLVVFGLLILDFNGIAPLKAAVRERLRTWAGVNDGLPEGREVVCPVCGSYKPLTRSFLLDVNLDRYPVIRPVKSETGSTAILPHRGINLRDISRREDLGWLRRQIVLRCADIIKKLAGD